MSSLPQPVTASQLRYLAAVADLTGDGPAPTYREIAAHLGVAVGAVHQQAARLRRHGLLDWRDGQCRTLRVTPAGLEAIANRAIAVAADGYAAGGG
jgi:DNA-binding MarR family transcriptional regulator